MRSVMLAALAAALVAAPAARAAEPLIIRHVTVESPERAQPVRGADVVIREGRIAAIGRNLPIPRGARVIEGRGRFLIPGLIDSHVHVGHSAALSDDEIERHPDLWAAYLAQVPRAFLAFGFTTVVDLDSTAAARRRFEAAPLRPHLVHCAEAVRVAGGYGAQRVPKAGAPNFPNLVYEPAAAKAWPADLAPGDFTPAKAVARVAQEGASCLKVFVEPGFGVFDWPVPHAQTLAALHAEAHARGLPEFVHATAAGPWRAALDSHAEVIAHGLWVWPGGPAATAPPAEVRAVIADAARAGVHVQPTLQVVAGERAMLHPDVVLADPRLGYALPAAVTAFLGGDEAKRDARELLDGYRQAAPSGDFERQLEATIVRTRSTFGLLLAAHAPLLFGTDTPAGDGIGNPPGLNGRWEMDGWAKAGASPTLILKAATLDNARALGLDAGVVAVGRPADLLLLRADPLRSVAAYDTIDTVFLGGRAIPREDLRGPG